MKGKFISFEGNEGSGKTSVIKEVKKRLENMEYDVIVTREPGGIRISEKIREIILNIDHKEMDARTEALLFAASRRQHLVEKILPSINAGKIVLCDRFIDSSLVYQGIARGLGIDEVYSINKFAIESTLPDLTIFVDVRPEVGLKRVFDTPSREINRLDLEKLNFHKKIYQGYHDLIEKYPNRIKKINGEQDKGKVVQEAMNLINKIL